MLGFRDIVAWLNIASISTASLLAGSTSALGQDSHLCTEINYVAVACAASRGISVEKDKPFIAVRVAKSSDRVFHENDLVARDAAGRIYEENHSFPLQFYGFKSFHEANTIWALGTVSILDCFGGKRIQLTPSTQTAIVQEPCAPLPVFRPSDHPFSYKLTCFLNTNSHPDTRVEDLGYKQLQTLKARGIRITWLGSEKDGDWKGKPTKVWEEWMSDELGVTLLWTYSDLRRQVENHATLQNIRREEPDASLFTIPSGYKITSWEQISLKSR